LARTPRKPSWAANTQIVIVSPYMKIHERLLNLLAEKISAAVSLTVIYGKKRMEEGLHEQLSKFDSTTIYFCPNLRAKVYANSEEAIVGSLNLRKRPTGDLLSRGEGL
jgi:hypothetical protein